MKSDSKSVATTHLPLPYWSLSGSLGEFSVAGILPVGSPQPLKEGDLALGTPGSRAALHPSIPYSLAVSGASEHFSGQLA